MSVSETLPPPSPLLPRILHALPAIARAAIPIVGVIWLRWPLPVVLFYFWLEIALMSIDTLVLVVRDRVAGNLIEFVLMGLVILLPVSAIAYYATLGLTWSGRWDYVLGMMESTGMRVAVALQVIVALAYAIARDFRSGEGTDRLLSHMSLIYNRLYALVLAAAVTAAILGLTGVGLPGPGKALANAVAVSTVAIVWLLSDLCPDRFDRWLNSLGLFGSRKRTAG